MIVEKITIAKFLAGVQILVEGSQTAFLYYRYLFAETKTMGTIFILYPFHD
jgi:hypothetical protein